MNNFERELRKIVGYCECIRNPKYVGRSCIGRLDDGIVVKMEFESTMIRDKYNALRVTFNLLGMASRTLCENGMKEQAKEKRKYLSKEYF